MSTLRDRLAAPRRRLALSLLLRLSASVAGWRRRARSRTALARLSDHELRDIGITLAERRHECLKPFWRG
jgi:uncharacterized protein YjiS (DUF1127 family)